MTLARLGESFYGQDFVEEDISKAFSDGLDDVVTGVKIEQGEPFMGKTTGKPHPIYNLSLSGPKTTRVRPLRFRVFREFHQHEVIPSNFKTKAKFPPTYTKSSFGIRMSDAELGQRCNELDVYMQEVFERRGEWSPKLSRAAAILMQIDKEKLLPPAKDDGAGGGGAAAAAAGGGGGATRTSPSGTVSLLDPEAVLEQWSRVKAQWDLLHNAKAVNRKHPHNRTAKALCALETWITDEVSDEGLKKLEKCVKSGLDNPTSGLGCYAMNPEDYDDLAPFFDKVVQDYHSKGGQHHHSAEQVHTASWSLSSSPALPIKVSVVSGGEAAAPTTDGAATNLCGVYDPLPSVDHHAPPSFVKRAAAAPAPAASSKVCLKFSAEESAWVFVAEQGAEGGGSGGKKLCASSPQRHSPGLHHPAALADGTTWALTSEEGEEVKEGEEEAPTTTPTTTLVALAVSTEEELDLRAYGLKEPLSMRVRVGRNLTSFPLPGAMSLEDRVKFESTMLSAFNALKANPEFGGHVYSMTPHDAWKAVTGEEQNPNLIDDATYQELVKRHIMFKDMAEDPYLASAGIANDWPCGRGCYQSADGGFIIWFGEEDQLRIMCMGRGFVLNEVFDRLHKALEVVESLPGVEFATSKKYGYVTSCPSNLGTGMRASVHLKIPSLTADGTDAQAKAVAGALGLAVRGTGGEHTPIGADGTVDISPSSRLFVTEAQIVTKLYSGIKLLLEKEKQATPLKNSALLFVKPHADTPACLGMVHEHLKVCDVSVVAEGKLGGEEINDKKLIDTHYYAIASKATILKPSQLNVPTDKFEAQFGLTWSDALVGGRVFNALDACAELGVSAERMDELWGQCKKAKKLVKFGGGFYCGLVEEEGKPPLYVFNGFFMSMRSKYTAPGASISWLVVEWDAKRLAWKDFRAKLLGPTDPAEASEYSLRGKVAKEWTSLGLSAAPNVGDNGVHGSASPFEAMAERLNWCKEALALCKTIAPDNGSSEEESVPDVAADSFGQALISHGVPEATILDWLKDPQVPLGDGTSGSLFDALEDLDAQACVDECVNLYQAQSALEGSVILHMKHGAYGLSGTKVSCVAGVRYAVFPTAEDAEALSMSGQAVNTAASVAFTPPFVPDSGASGKKPRRFLKTVRRAASTGAIEEDVRTAAMTAATNEAAALKIKLKLLDVAEEITDRRGGEADDARPLAYLVKWEGKPYEEMAWVPADHKALTGSSDAKALVAAFEETRRLAIELEEEANEVAEEAFRKSTSQAAEEDLPDTSGKPKKPAGISEEFKEALENGIKLVKFNRKGQAAFRTISMLSADDTILHWKPTAKPGITARMVRSTFKAETVDLRTLKDVRIGEAPDPEAEGKWGTPTLRMYVSKNSHGVKMLRGGITFTLVFKDRSLDFGADNTAQRDFLVKGFTALQAKVMSGGIAEGNEAEDE